ncbi:MAG: hypothetical protein M5R38_03365 [Candidatus Methylomirabilis sp.]|nr:hypothetical protein [Candidatus Methylomirabilis sp.]
MRILIRGGRVIDPAAGLDDLLDLFIEDGKIVRIDKNTGGGRREAGGADTKEPRTGKRGESVKKCGVRPWR